MTQTANMEDMHAHDNWDMLDTNTYWLPLAPATLGEFFSGETANLFVRQEDGRWWLSHSGRSGTSDYDTASAAKDAGNEICHKSHEEMESVLIREIGLPVEEWDFRFGDGIITITSKADSSIEIVGVDGTWSIEGEAPANISRMLAMAHERLSPRTAPKF